MKSKFKKNESGIFIPVQGTGIMHGKNSVGPIVLACGSISAGLLADCNTKPVAGTETEIYVANRADIDTLAYNATNSLIVEGITMVGSAVFYKFKGIRQSNAPSAKMNKTKYSNNWIHALDFLLFANDGAAKKIVTDFSESEVVVIYQNKWKGSNGNMAWEMLGYSAGLVLTAAERNPNDAESAGAWKLSLGPDEGQFEDNVPLTIFDTDLTTTTSLVTSLT